MTSFIQNSMEERTVKGKQRLFEEISDHILHDDRPSVSLENMVVTEAFSQYPFDMLKNLKSTGQSPLHHPEGNVWNHTMLVVDAAAQRKEKSSDQRVFMWAALLHDIGKPGTTRVRKGKITSYNHEKLGAEMVKEFLQYFHQNASFIEQVSALVRWHMQLLFVIKNLPFADIKSMTEQTQIQDVALLGLCDRLGRLNADTEKEEEAVRLFLQKCH